MYKAHIMVIPPCLSEELIYTLNELLDETPKAEQMNAFFNAYGTHSVRWATYGARFVAVSSYNK